jgi:hypothetical protein
MHRIFKIASVLIFTVAACVVAGVSWGLHENSDTASKNQAAAVKMADQKADAFILQLQGGAGSPLPTDDRIRELASRQGVGVPRISRMTTQLVVTFSVGVFYSNLSFDSARVVRCYRSLLSGAAGAKTSLDSIPCG